MSTAARSSSSLRGDDGMSETKGNDVASVSSLSCDLRSVCVFLQSKLEYIAKMLLTSILSLLCWHSSSTRSCASSKFTYYSAASEYMRPHSPQQLLLLMMIIFDSADCEIADII